jgi:outer membrane protein assembly factor BamB
MTKEKTSLAKVWPYLTITATMTAAMAAAMTASLPAHAQNADWLTDGGDKQRSGWQKDEHILSPASVKGLTLLWKADTGNEARALHNLMPALVVHSVETGSGAKQVVLVSGISDNLYAYDAADGTLLWKKHFEYAVEKPNEDIPADFAAIAGGKTPKTLNFLEPGGSSDTPVIGPQQDGKWPVYFVDGGGVLHILNLADGSDLKAPVTVKKGKAWALNLDGDTLWMPTINEMYAINLAKTGDGVKGWESKSGGLWGRRGAAIDSHGVAWSTTGDGNYDASNDEYANALVGLTFGNSDLQLKDYYVPTNWQWLQKRDLDPNNTPTIFHFHGRELIAASGKECRLALLDPNSIGGPQHQQPLFRSDLFCNEEVDFQDRGSWGALSSWEDDKGTRWILAPFWGPAHSKFHFPITNSPATVKGGMAAFKVVDEGGKIEAVPVWVSRDMDHGEPAVIANGIIFTYGSGDFTQQASPDKGLNFDSSIRAKQANHVTLYALDAQTGKELYSSGDIIKTFNHFSGISVANGHVYISSYDGVLYCFGLKQ